MNNDNSLRTLFGEALDLTDPAERTTWLEEVCDGDDMLRQRLELLLRAHDEAGGFLSQPSKPPTASPGRGPGFLPPSEQPGDWIGRYKLLEQIGEGGCGVVYMAEQEEPVRRRVALKVIKLGMDTRQVIARFEAERQALALMEHPNIARVLDAGATESGRPFFVMELVRGIRITDFCDQQKLSPRERLKLFIPICHAIQHAHQKGIVHRDLKPSNVLVTTIDGQAVPKVIDFGIAKATNDQQLTDKTVFTAFAHFIGTPAYMSPEQAEMSGVDIDTRTDIYSLGVLLYELLTGQTPFDRQRLGEAALDEIRRIIRKTDPPKPSMRLHTLAQADLTTVAQARQTDAPKLIHQMQGDLDWIVMKCLEKDRNRRYETVNGLAMDVQRHLTSEPIVARPPTRMYRLQKLVRRNKLSFAAGTAVLLVLLAGIAASTWQAVRATRAEQAQRNLRQAAEVEKKKSQTEAAKATAISGFLQQLLGSADPDALKGSDYTVRELLDDFTASLTTQLEGQPEVEAAVRATVGKAYRCLGVLDKALEHHQRAVALRRRIASQDAEPLAECLVECAWVFHEQGLLTKAEPLLQEAMNIYRTRGTSGQPIIYALWTLQRNLLLQDRIAESELAVDEAIAIAAKSPHLEFPELPNMIHAKAEVKNRQFRYAEGEALSRQALQIHRRLHGEDHPETAWATLGLGISLSGQGKLMEAEAALKEALRVFSKYYPAEHRSITWATAELKQVFTAMGDSTGLENLARQRLSDLVKRVETRIRTAGSEDPEVATILMALSSLHQEQGDLTEAETVARRALAIRRKLLGNEDMAVAEILRLLAALAAILNANGKPAEAEAHSREELAIRRKLLGNEHSQVANTLGALARYLHDQGKLAEAESVCREALAMRRKLLGSSHPDVGRSLWNLAAVLNSQGRRAEIEALCREAAEHVASTDAYTLHEWAWLLATSPDRNLRDGPTAVTFAERATAATNREDPLILATLAAAYAETGEFAHAVRVQQEAIALSRNDIQKNAAAARLQVYESGSAYRDHDQLAQMILALLEEGNPHEAEPLARECLALREKTMPDNWLTFNARSLLGGTLLAQAKYSEAEPLLVSGYEGMKEREETIPAEDRPARLQEVIRRLVHLYEAIDRAEETAQWKEKLAEIDRAAIPAAER